MNKNTTIIAAIVIVLLLTGGIFLYSTQGTMTPSTTATSTPTGGTDDGTPVTTSPKAPVATTNASVTPTGTTAVVVGGVVPNGAMTTYWYEYGASTNLGLKSATQTIGSGYTSLAAPAYLTQLAKDTTYYFRLVAENSVGKSTGATQSFHTTTTTTPPVGSVPAAQSLAATLVARTGATLNGAVTPNLASTQYWFEYGDSANLGNVSNLQSAGNGSGKTNVTLPLTNLAPLTTYYFRLNAQNQFGTTNGAVLTFKTSGPALSTAVPVVTTQVAVFATTTATLRGTVNPTGTQTDYWFEYGTNSSLTGNSLKTTSKTSAGATSNTITIEKAISGLGTKTTYYYRTVAESSAGTVRGATLSFKTN